MEPCQGHGPPQFPSSSSKISRLVFVLRHIFQCNAALCYGKGWCGCTRRSSVWVNPGIARETAFSKVEKLAQPLYLMSDCPEHTADFLKQELEKARAASRQPPIDVEVEHCRRFIAKAEKKVAELFAERHSRVQCSDRSEGPPPAFGGRTSSSYEPPGTLRAVTIEIVPRSLR